MDLKTMDKTIIILLVLSFFIALAGIHITNINNFNSVQQDLNVLKNNDQAFASYINANSQALTQLQELSKNCKTIEDTNYSQTIQCVIPKGGQ